MVVGRSISIPFIICLLIFLLSVSEGFFYLTEGKTFYLTGLGIFFLEISMLIIDVVYPSIFDKMPEFHRVEFLVLLILVSILFLIASLKVLIYFFKYIEQICIGDKMLNTELRRIKSVLIFLMFAKTILLLDYLTWILSGKGMFISLGDEIEEIITNVISVFDSALLILLILLSISYVNKFRETSNLNSNN